MLATMIEKELKAILLSPKFSVTFLVCAALIVLSVFVGIKEYQSNLSYYETESAANDQSLRASTSWLSITPSIHRKPQPLSIFASGVSLDIGRTISVRAGADAELNGGYYSDNLIFATFRTLDFILIVQIVLSLFAIMFTYDAVCGERQAGTLKLAFSNGLPRARFIIAKLAGSWLGLVLPLTLPILIGVLMVMLFRVPMTTSDWMQLGVFMAISVLYFTFFICLGVLVSSLTRQANVSFLILLVMWVALVFVLPRVGLMVAKGAVEVESASEIGREIGKFRREQWRGYEDLMAATNREREDLINNVLISSKNKEQDRQKLFDLNERITNDLDKRRQELQANIDEFARGVREEWRNRQAARDRLGLFLSRLSPASSYQLAAMEIMATGVNLKADFETRVRDYNRSVGTFLNQQQGIEQKNRQQQMRNSGGGEQNQTPIDISLMPRFHPPSADLGVAFQNALVDTGLLALYTLLAIAGACFAFLRYDLR